MKSKNTSLKDLSSSTGIPRTTLHEWSMGRCPQLSEDLIKLSRHFNVPLEYLLTGEDSATESIKDFFKEAGEEFFQVHRGTYRITVERKVPMNGD